MSGSVCPRRQDLRCAETGNAPSFSGMQGTRRSTTVGPQIRESLAALVINIDACRRWLSADPPNIQQARAAMERMTCNANALTKITCAYGHDDHA
jgi:hypothetical protein